MVIGRTQPAPEFTQESFWVLYLVIGLGALWRWWYLTPTRCLIVSDLTVFWVAAQFALSGHAAVAYYPGQLHMAMLAAWILPLVVVVIAWVSHVQIGPFVLVALLWQIMGYMPEVRFRKWRIG